MLDKVKAAPAVAPEHSEGGSADYVITVDGVLAFLRRSTKTALLSVAGVLCLAGLYLVTATPLFTARAQLLIDSKVPQLMREQWAEASLILDNAQVESQIAVLASEQISRAVVESLALYKEPEFADLALRAPTAASPLTSDEIRPLINAYIGGLDIRRLGLSYVLEVSYTARDAAKAAKIANAVVEAYARDQLATRAQAARQGSEWLEERINALRLQMNDAALNVQEFKARRDYRITSRREQPAGEGGEKAEAAPPAQTTETLDELESTAATYRRLYESYLQAYTESVQRQSYPVTNARIITYATPPTFKSSPKKGRTIVLAALFGLMLGFGIALVREGLGK